MIGTSFADLLAAAQAADETAFAVLWRDANPGLLRYVRLLAPDAAEDVTAEVWLHVVRGLAGFRGAEPDWRAWLFSIARNRAIDEARRRSRRPTAPLDERATAVAPMSADAADVALEQLSTHAAIALVATLPRLQAEVILLRVVAGLDTDRVAALVGRSPGAVRVAAHRGLRQLATMFPEGAVTP